MMAGWAGSPPSSLRTPPLTSASSGSSVHTVPPSTTKYSSLNRADLYQEGRELRHASEIQEKVKQCLPAEANRQLKTIIIWKLKLWSFFIQPANFSELWTTCPAELVSATPQCSSPTVCSVLGHSGWERGTHPLWSQSNECISYREKSHKLVMSVP